MIGPQKVQTQGENAEEVVFCHTFDLAKRLALPVGSAMNYIAVPRTTASSASPLMAILQNVQQQLVSTPATCFRSTFVFVCYDYTHNIPAAT